MPEKEYLYSISEEDDQRLRSKLNTLKKQARFMQVTQPKRRKKSVKKNKLSSSQSQKQVKYLIRSEVEERLGEKVKEFKVISRTLRQFFKGSGKKSKTIKENLQFGLKMIKAFNKTHIQEVSPYAKELIDEILNSLKGLNEDRKKFPQQRKEKEYSHQRQFTFSNNFTNDKLKYGNYLVNEIQMLSNNLHELKEQAEVLESLKQDFDERQNHINKKKYIQELQQIVRAQKDILFTLQTQNQHF